jgi:CRISPR-associated protein Csm4
MWKTMPYSLYKLTFPAGAHFGADTGPSPDDTRMTVRVDTLFSALFIEALSAGCAQELLDAAQAGHLILSDGLPYNAGDLYLPKPIYALQHPAARPVDTRQAKALRKLEYIPLSLFADYIRGLSGTQLPADTLDAEFGLAEVRVRAAIRGQEEPTPYQAAVYRFRPGCGLYLIVYHRDDAVRDMFSTLLNNLAPVGIGGQRSPGWGGFAVQQSPVPPSLLALLDAQEAPVQMLLGTALPAQEELDTALQGGWYALVRRAGFVASPTHAPTPLRKHTTYALQPGSCLSARFTGCLLDVSPPGGSHPVWRLGKTLFAGVHP